ncbi:ShlB/FhaC/HecB family hemolysin secretion/activation protein [Hydrogenophaga sp. 5NK40-0174]|uniref:ShlB/FhaC/HecB family hemolysin secretion/activation protein n=1 Tax=Hydrogenophaga sp. 5NK40-0174 TaxID=3127649 RepID=UPI0031083D59
MGQARKVALCLTAAMINIGQAWAQDALPDPSQELIRQQEREEALKALQAPQRAPAPADLREDDAGRLVDGESPCFAIQSVQLVGPDADEFSFALSAVTGPEGDDNPIGRCLGVNSINLLQKRLQNAIMERGYVTTRVIVQNQNIASGNLQFFPIAGRIEKLNSGDASGVNFGAAMPADVGDLLNLRDVEQALENLKRVPTADADIQIAPGTRPGESELQLKWRQDKQWRFGVSVDDAGSDATGKFQSSFTASLDNPLGQSDLAYATYSRALGGGDGPSPKGSQSLTLHYSIPYGYWLFSANGSVNQYHQTVLGAFDNYEYSGEGSNFSLNASRVLWRDSRNVTTASVGLQRRTSRNYIDDTEILVQRRAVTSVEAVLSHRLYWDKATVTADVQYRQGIKALGSLEAPEEPYGEGTSQYRLTTLGLRLQAPITESAGGWTYSGSFKTQFHHTPLTPQDRFSIGGRYTVRGFDSSASITAERGFLLRNDFVTASPWLLDGTQVYLGLDAGRVSGPSALALSGTRLVGAAIGWRGQWAGTQFDVFWGKPISKPPELKADSSVWGFMLYRAF